MDVTEKEYAVIFHTREVGGRASCTDIAKAMIEGDSPATRHTVQYHLKKMLNNGTIRIDVVPGDRPDDEEISNKLEEVAELLKENKQVLAYDSVCKMLDDYFSLQFEIVDWNAEEVK